MSPPDGGAGQRDSDDEPPDVEIDVGLRARELRLECKPKVRVTFFSDTPARAEEESERDNLPDALEPGVTYRNVGLRWRAAARLEDPED
jgi:hypothetical protein